MTEVKIKSLSGSALNWAVQYTDFIHMLLKDRRDRRALKDDHDQAKNHISKLDIIAVPTIERIVNIVLSLRIATYEDCGKWFAISSDELSTWMRDADGVTAHIMIYKNEAIIGESYEEAVKRCYVKMTLGETI